MQLAEGGKSTQAIIVFGIVLLGLIIAGLLFIFKPTAEKKPAPYEPPQVSFIQVKPQSVRIDVQSQGTIQAKSEINLSVEVPGRISEISPQLNDGEFFRKGDLLARIDSSDYALAITRAEAQVAAAQQALARVDAEAAQARQDLQRMGQDISKASPYALREPHLQEARANLKAARADLEIARLQYQRTFIRAPFDGRVIKRNIGVSEYVAPGIALARIYSTSVMELKLPLTQRQVRLVNLPLQDNGQAVEPTRVILETSYAGKTLHWEARLTRTESVIDTRNRLLNAIAEIDGAELIQADAGSAELTAGLFVRASIQGKLIDNVFVIPRSALRSGDQVWLAGSDKLDIRQVSVLHKDDENAYIETGLVDGDRVITSALDYAIQGMQISPME